MNNALLIRKRCKFIYTFFNNLIKCKKIKFGITIKKMSSIHNVYFKCSLLFLIDQINSKSVLIHLQNKKKHKTTENNQA